MSVTVTVGNAVAVSVGVNVGVCVAVDVGVYVGVNVGEGGAVADGVIVTAAGAHLPRSRIASSSVEPRARVNTSTSSKITELPPLPEPAIRRPKRNGLSLASDPAGTAGARPPYASPAFAGTPSRMNCTPAFGPLRRTVAATKCHAASAGNRRPFVPTPEPLRFVKTADRPAASTICRPR
ncbi:MAG: hypothetical protein IPG72_09545 [Ardenticatenales bacterium]|nr:hypothetical protein [Ardenticatenales bacterium]